MQNIYCEVFQEEEDKHDSEYKYEDETNAEDVEQDSDSDSFEPYNCMEYNQKNYE